MRSVRTALCALAAAATAALAAPLTAEAAKGRFSYGSLAGPQTMTNPPSHRPLTVPGLFFADNATDRHAHLYADPLCKSGRIGLVAPHTREDVLAFACVMFRPYR